MTRAEERLAQAAERCARAVAGLAGARGLVARRVTGTPGLSGVWQCYLPVPRRHGGGLTSAGPNIHVSSDGRAEVRS